MKADVDLSGVWAGTKGGRLAKLKELELDGDRVSYLFTLGGKQTGRDGGCGVAPLSSFVGPDAKYTRIT